jgi:hypothetical protein
VGADRESLQLLASTANHCGLSIVIATLFAKSYGSKQKKPRGFFEEVLEDFGRMPSSWAILPYFQEKLPVFCGLGGKWTGGA